MNNIIRVIKKMSFDNPPKPYWMIEESLPTGVFYSWMGIYGSESAAYKAAGITRYWGRYFLSGKWYMWHLINGATDRDNAYAIFTKGTRFEPSEIEITDIEPEHYAGREA